MDATLGLLNFGNAVGKLVDSFKSKANGNSSNGANNLSGALVEVMKTLTTATTHLSEVISNLIVTMGGVQNAIPVAEGSQGAPTAPIPDKAQAPITAPVTQMGGGILDGLKTLDGALDHLASVISNLIVTMGGTLNAVPVKEAAAAPVKAPPILDNAAAPAKKPAAKGPSAMGSIAGVASAFNGVASAAEALVGKLAGFVQAINPSLMEVFNRSLENLQATVGVAFQPVFEALSKMFDQVGGMILPVMEALRPIIANLMGVLQTALTPLLELWVAVETALIPVFDALVTILGFVIAICNPIVVAFRVLADIIGIIIKLFMAVFQPVIDLMKAFSGIMKMLAQVVNVIMIVFKTLAEVLVAFIASLFGGLDLGDLMKDLKSALEKLVGMFLIFVAHLLMAFGMVDVLDKLIKNLNPDKKGATAMGPSSIQSLDAIVRQQNESAASASGGAEADKDPYKLAIDKALAEMTLIKDGLKPIGGMAADIATIARVLSVGTGFVKGAGKVAGKISGALMDPLNIFGEA